MKSVCEWLKGGSYFRIWLNVNNTKIFKCVKSGKGTIRLGRSLFV